MFLQKTIKRKITIEGIGLHSGKKAKLTLVPAPADVGIHFVRKDLEGCPSVAVSANNVTATSMATTLASDRFSIATVEHCLSSLAALRIDNLYMELDGPEIPICDGSAKSFYQAIREAGDVEQSMPRKYLYITKPIHFGSADKHAYVIPYQGLRLTCTIDFPHPAIGFQKIDLDINEQTYGAELSTARTFGFTTELEMLRSKGLAMGASLDNAIALDSTKVLNPDGLRFKDEFVRHKAMDALGDLVTLGYPLLGHVVLYKAGHDLLNKLVKKILDSKDSFQFMDLGSGVPQVEPFEIPF